MNSHSSLLLLLSTFNGEKYLAAQLNSIIAQTFCHWTLIIRDDGSHDSTHTIIKQYSDKDQRIICLKDQTINLKTSQSMSLLMQYALTRHESYVFFCDQDDIWLSHKLAFTMNKLTSLESQHGKETSILVHTDLQVVNRDLKTLHLSYLQYEGLSRNPESPVKTLLINNYVTGCTIGMNKALLEMATPIPKGVFMHDWWCALCAAAGGKIGFVNEATVLYRQHATNAIGSKGVWGKLRELRTPQKFFLQKLNTLRCCRKQAENILLRMDTANNHYKLIQQFASATHQHFLARYLAMIKLRLRSPSKLRGILFWLTVGFI